MINKDNSNRFQVDPKFNAFVKSLAAQAHDLGYSARTLLMAAEEATVLLNLRLTYELREKQMGKNDEQSD